MGISRRDITPANLEGLDPFAGTFARVHDHIHIRAMVVSNGSDTAAIVAADLIEVGDTRGLRSKIEEKTGIRADHVMIAPSHSHNTPRMGDVPAGAKARIPTQQSLRYSDEVAIKISDAIEEARASMTDAQMGISTIGVDVNVNREVYSQGSWGLGVNPDGDSEKKLTAICFRGDDQRIIAVLINYAVHSTIMLGIPELSGDLAGAVSRYVEHELGKNALAMWIPGVIGDQAPLFGLNGETGEDMDEDLRFAEDAVDAQSFIIGASVMRAIEGMHDWDKSAAISGTVDVVSVPCRKLPVPEGMEQRQVSEVELTLSTLLVGTVCLVGISGEVTTAIYRHLMREMPLRHVLVVSNANSRIGYLAGDESYDRHTQAADGCPIAKGHCESVIVRIASRQVGNLLRLATQVDEVESSSQSS
ncbi:hypothetical protein [Bifidobacterium sp.]|uniref:hypothetical protein n=1 Tax=Bifidobacterium sp. TaxID=41200 RepID=UPI0039E8AF6C